MQHNSNIPRERGQPSANDGAFNRRFEKPTRIFFAHWLVLRAAVDDPGGDLARRVLRDSTFKLASAQKFEMHVFEKRFSKNAPWVDKDRLPIVGEERRRIERAENLDLYQHAGDYLLAAELVREFRAFKRAEGRRMRELRK